MGRTLQKSMPTFSVRWVTDVVRWVTDVTAVRSSSRAERAILGVDLAPECFLADSGRISSQGATL